MEADVIPDGNLTVAAGFASETGRRPDNQDFGGVYLGTATERARHGLVAVVADGVGGAKAGRMAAELAVRSLVEGFYSQPETIGAAQAIERVMTPYNRWLHSMGQSPAMAHAATTFTAIVARGRRAHVIHVGDSRAWHFRGGKLRQITEDHTLKQAEQDHILYRALGIEAQLRLDQYHVDLAEHDRLLLTTDGVHGSLSIRQIERLLAARGSAEMDVAALVEAALSAGSRDNTTALIVDIVTLPAPDHDGLAGELAILPILAPPMEGDSVDGFVLDQQIADGQYTRLFRSTEPVSGAPVAIKFPKLTLLSEHGARLAFTREALIGQRVNSPFVGATMPVDALRQTRLYSVQPYYEGSTLLERITHGAVNLDRAIEIAIRLVRGVAALHRLEIIHRDIKPENVMLLPDGGVKLIDLGVARLPRVEDFHPTEIPGTPSYMAPEQFDGNAGDPGTDQFALGVTLFRLLTGKYPYGEQEAFSRPRFGQPAPPSSFRGEIPAWLDVAILRAVAVSPEDRFGDVVELLRAIEGGGALVRHDSRRGRALLERNPVLFWQLIALGLAIALAIMLVSR
jgi:serine/threonine protein phosphatase PrpC